MKQLLRISLLTIAIAVWCVPLCAAKAKKQAIFVDPGFRFENVDTIYILPAVDLTVDKDKDPEKRLHQVDCSGPFHLEKRGYRTVPERGKCKELTHPARMNVTEDDLKEPQESWIRKLGPDDAHWVLILALEDVSSHLTFGSTGKAIVMGMLFDRQNGKLVWRAIGASTTGQGGLLGMAMKGAMSDMAIDDAVKDLCTIVEKHGKKK